MKIYVGKQTPQHKGDTSRELIDMWEESGFCEIIRGKVDDVYLWANEPNDILLYEYPRTDSYPNLPSKWNFGLFGNMQYNSDEASPWIFWARHPKKLESKISEGVKSYDDRDIESVFIGKVENHIQTSNRTRHDWSSCVELFSMPITIGDSLNWPYTQDEYLDILSFSKFGLSLAGFGPKCNREIEYMGLGVVPIVSPEVDMTYYDPLKEGVHYFRAKNPFEVCDIISRTSKKEWEDISSACRSWYEKNCSRRGSFETTQKIINENT